MDALIREGVVLSIMVPESFDAIPADLKALVHWVCWKLKDNGGPKHSKVPYTIAGFPAKTTDPTSWSSFDEAVAAMRSDSFDGIGFVFTSATGFVGVDLDHAFNDEGELFSWAREIVNALSAYTEISPSGTGLHIIVRGNLPPGGCRRDNVEIYNNARYFTITGNRFEDTPAAIEERTTEIRQIHRKYIATKDPAHPTLSDSQLIEKARKAKNGETFRRLYDQRDLTEYGNDHSAADLALCGMLWFWVGLDAARIDSLFRASALMRDKWDSTRGASTYGRNTIERILTTSTSRIITHPKTPPSDGLSDGTLSATYLRPTDASAASWFTKFNGNDVRYVVAQRRFYIFDGKRWLRDDDAAVYRLAKAIVPQLYAIVAETHDDATRKAIARLAFRLESSALVDRMIQYVRTSLTMSADKFDQDPFLLNFLNGTVDLRTGTLRAHSADDLITKIVQLEYDPSAKCERWANFIQEVFAGDQNLIDCVCRAVGYSATGDTREQVLFFLTGTGANGKSTFLETLADVLGEYSTRTTTETVLAKRAGAATNDLAALRGIRLARASEIAKERRLDEAVVKDVTGGDTISARYLYSEYFSYRPEFKLWIACNHLPTIDGSDKAMQRRIRVIPFRETFRGARRDENLRERLRDESQGIAAWIVRGALDWSQHGLGSATAMEIATKSYISANDLFSQFMDQMCVVGTGETVGAKMLRDAFSAWCIEGGLDISTQAEFTSALAAHGFVWRRGNKGRKWLGLSLLPTERGVVGTGCAEGGVAV